MDFPDVDCLLFHNLDCNICEVVTHALEKELKGADFARAKDFDDGQSAAPGLQKPGPDDDVQEPDLPVGCIWGWPDEEQRARIARLKHEDMHRIAARPASSQTQNLALVSKHSEPPEQLHTRLFFHVLFKEKV